MGKGGKIGKDSGHGRLRGWWPVLATNGQCGRWRGNANHNVVIEGRGIARKLGMLIATRAGAGRGGWARANACSLAKVMPSRLNLAPDWINPKLPNPTSPDPSPDSPLQTL